MNAKLYFYIKTQIGKFYGIATYRRKIFDLLGSELSFNNWISTQIEDIANHWRGIAPKSDFSFFLLRGTFRENIDIL